MRHRADMDCVERILRSPWHVLGDAIWPPVHHQWRCFLRNQIH